MTIIIHDNLPTHHCHDLGFCPWKNKREKQEQDEGGHCPADQVSHCRWSVKVHGIQLLERTFHLLPQFQDDAIVIHWDVGGKAWEIVWMQRVPPALEGFLKGRQIFAAKRWSFHFVVGPVQIIGFFVYGVPKVLWILVTKGLKQWITQQLPKCGYCHNQKDECGAMWDCEGHREFLELDKERGYFKSQLELDISTFYYKVYLLLFGYLLKFVERSSLINKHRIIELFFNSLVTEMDKWNLGKKEELKQRNRALSPLSEPINWHEESLHEILPEKEEDHWHLPGGGVWLGCWGYMLTCPRGGRGRVHSSSVRWGNNICKNPLGITRQVSKQKIQLICASFSCS